MTSANILISSAGLSYYLCLPQRTISTIITPGKVLGELPGIVHFKSFLFNRFCAGLFLALMFQLHWPPWTHQVLSSLRTLVYAISPPALFWPLVFHGWIPCLLAVLAEIVYLQIVSPQALFISFFLVTLCNYLLLTVYLSCGIVKPQRRRNMLVLFTSINSPVVGT